MRTRLLVIAAAALLAAGVWLLRNEPRGARPTAGTTVIALGDSLISGHGSTSGRDLVSVLSQRIGVPIVNAGRGGDTTATALARLDRDVLARDPRLVIVLLGGNDFLRKLPVDETFANLTTIVERIRGRGAAVVVVGLRLGLLGDPYSRGYAELAERTSSAYVPDIFDGIINNPARMADAIHPNDEGYRLMAERIEPSVRRLLEPE